MQVGRVKPYPTLAAHVSSGWLCRLEARGCWFVSRTPVCCGFLLESAEMLRLAGNSNLAVGVDASLCACDDLVAPLYLYPGVSWIGPWLQDKQWQKMNTKQKTSASSSFSSSQWQADACLGQITQRCSNSWSGAWGFVSSCKAVVPRFLISSSSPVWEMRPCLFWFSVFPFVNMRCSIGAELPHPPYTHRWFNSHFSSSAMD